MEPVSVEDLYQVEDQAHAVNQAVQAAMQRQRARNEPTPVLPIFSQFDFVSWWNFKTTLARLRLRFPSLVIPRMVTLFEDGIFEAVTVLSEEGAALNTDKEISDAMDAVLLPGRSEDKIAALSNAQFCPAPGLRLSAQLPVHFGMFSSLMTALGVPEDRKCKLFKASLNTLPAVQVALRSASQLGEAEDLRTTFKVALTKSLELDLAMGFTAAGKPVAAAPAGFQAPPTTVSAATTAATSVVHKSSVDRPIAAGGDRLPSAEHAACLRDRTCFFCRQVGHKRSECPQLAAPSRHSERLAARAPASQGRLGAIGCAACEDERPFVEVFDEQHGVQVRALLDTGSTMSATSLAYLDKLGVPRRDITEREHLTSVAMADGTPVPVTGTCFMSLRFPGVDQPKAVAVAVLSDADLRYLVLGASDMVPGALEAALSRVKKREQPE